MKIIPLTQGRVTKVDDADYDRVSRHKWYAWKSRICWYAARSSPRDQNGKQKFILLHRFLLPGIPEIDHRDGDGLNNQRDNLRPATHSDNQAAFQHRRRKTSSRFRGVNWNKARQKWKAKIVVKGVASHLGYFTREIEAASAYDAAARERFGEFASPNFP